jgi:hypothetical protein
MSWCSEAQRALLLRVLAALADSHPEVVRAEDSELLPLLSPLLHGVKVAAAFGGANNSCLSAVLGCFPYVVRGDQVSRYTSPNRSKHWDTCS